MKYSLCASLFLYRLTLCGINLVAVNDLFILHKYSIGEYQCVWAPLCTIPCIRNPNRNRNWIYFISPLHHSAPLNEKKSTFHESFGSVTQFPMTIEWFECVCLSVCVNVLVLAFHFR